MRYLVTGVVTVSVYTYVEADSEEEALIEAGQRELAKIHIGGGYEADEFFHMSADGSPYDLRVED